MENARRTDTLLTSGRLFSKIIFFVLPIMASNLLQVFYNAADMIVVGLSNEPDSVGAIGTTISFIELILNMFMGFSVGINILVAQRIGANRKEDANNAVHTGLLVGLIIGVVSGVIAFSVSNSVMSAMGNGGKLLELSVVYTHYYFCGTPFIAITNCAIAVFRAKGDSKTPLMVLSVAGILNVILNLFFVLVLNMSVDGVALATVISNVFSAFVLCFILTKLNDCCKLQLKKLSINKRALKDICLLGIPASIQGMVFSVSNMLIQSSIIRVNNSVCSVDSAFQPVVKGNSAASNLEGFCYNATNSVYQAVVTFVGQNYGAKQYDRVKKSVLYCCIITTVIAVVFGCGMYLLKNPLLALYGVVKGTEGSLERIAYDTSVWRMKIMLLTYIGLAVMEVGSGFLKGLGKSMTSTIISLCGACLFRIFWLETVFEKYLTIQSIYISYPISWILTAIVSFIFASIIFNKKVKVNKELEKTI